MFRALSSANHFGSMLACGAFMALFWYYPKRLVRFNIGPWLVGFYLLIALCDLLQVLPLGNYGMQIAIMSGGLGGGLLALLQWHVTRGEPVQRASLQWFLLSWCLGFGIYLAVVTIPALAGFDSGNVEAYAFGGCLLIAVGLVLGIARYRLFELESWWFRAIGLLLGGALVVLVDVLLTSLLEFDTPVALAVSLGVTGWVYFPARQWVVGRIYTRVRRLRARDLPSLLHEVVSRELETPDRLLPEALRRLYSPLCLKPMDWQPAAVRIAEDGLVLQVPGLQDQAAWEARWADDGKRLFSSYDIETMTAVRGVLERIAAYQHAVQRGIEQERARLTQDLHDDIGARLLTLLHRHPGEIGTEVRDLLERLRLTVHGLGAAPLTLAQCLDAWCAETVERCNAVGIDLDWRQPEHPPEHRFDPVVQVDLTRVMREAVSNALTHARPSRLQVDVDAVPDRLRIVVLNDGATADSGVGSGLGLRNMRTRMQRLGGEMEFTLVPPMARAGWTLDLNPQPLPSNGGFARA